MGEICRFGTNAALKCILSATQMRGMRNLTITGETTAEAATSGSQEYMKRKSGKPVTVSFEVILSAFTGCNTQSEAISLITAARDGQTEYLYVGGSKLVPCRLMLTRAEAKEFILTPKGKMAHCVVSLTFQQASNNDGSMPGSSSSGSSSAAKAGTSAGKAGVAGAVGKAYKVQIPGMSTTTVIANSVAEAISKAAPSWTGTIYVDGVAYNAKTKTRITSTSNTAATAAKAAVAGAVAAVSGVNRVVANAQKNSTAQKTDAAKNASSKTTTLNSLLSKLRSYNASKK